MKNQKLSSTNEKPEISSATNEKKLTLYIGISGSGKVEKLKNIKMLLKSIVID